MKPKINKKYKLRFDVKGKLLTYTATIIDTDEMFISFQDRYNAIITYNLQNLISFEEVHQ